MGIVVPNLSLPVDKEARRSNHEYIEQCFEAAMQRRR